MPATATAPIELLDLALTTATERGMDELARQITSLGEDWLAGPSLT